ncbi:ATP-binding cassette domain-containing protein [Bacteroides nordii]|uniref:ATP-binding cassette domain-containing protein n=1 Tax=Bacteroides nordii TaxID=291645 RepID=UPI001899C01E|nr:ATP-binding cassette domain-containing protein [Bacteroides nordii]
MEMEVVVDNISKRYGKVEALRGVSFAVKPGELFGLIGPDGAGKSTLFRILTTLLLADEGTATVGGADMVKDYKEIRRKVGYMPGRFSLYQDLTVEENLNFFATVFHTTIEENYDLVKDIYQQIEPFKKRRAGALSGGMKQKLALSCALIHKPDILFLDEPTTGVDPVSRKEFWEMLRRLKEQGITIIASTPIMDEARQCDRIAFINEGQIHGIDTPECILREFAHILCPPGLEREELRHKGETVIEVDNLCKRFGTFTAVDHISFQVNRGEIFGFLGVNGAGKTTAMRMLCGLSKPTSGSGRVAGFDLFTQSEEIKKNIGYMSQKFSLYEDLKVWENIRLFAGIYGMKEREIANKTDELLERLGFTAERETLVKSLPLGWKQKLAFSVSIFHEPKIVFLDEPTGGVDPATRRQFWELIYQAADRGITVFVTTHYMDEAEYCDRVSIMVDGRIEALDTPRELKEKFHAQTMDDVFQQLARKAVRKAD